MQSLMIWLGLLIKHLCISNCMWTIEKRKKTLKQKFSCKQNSNKKAQGFNWKRKEKLRETMDLFKPLFGSQLVTSTSKTPYSDATQVRGITFLLRLNFIIFPFHHHHRRRLRSLPSISKRISIFFCCLCNILRAREMKRNKFVNCDSFSGEQKKAKNFY